MTPDEFVVQIRKSVLDENLSIYKDLFASTAEKNASDPYWKRALALFAILNEKEKHVMFEIIRQVMVDTISNVFAVLDGVSQLDGVDGEFRLLFNSSVNQLNGQLQDRLLEIEETK